MNLNVKVLLSVRRGIYWLVVVEIRRFGFGKVSYLFHEHSGKDIFSKSVVDR